MGTCRQIGPSSMVSWSSNVIIVVFSPASGPNGSNTISEERSASGIELKESYIRDWGWGGGGGGVAGGLRAIATITDRELRWGKV